MKEEYLNRLQDLTDAVARYKERERLIKVMLDTAVYIDEDRLRVILDYPKTVPDDPIPAEDKAPIRVLPAEEESVMGKIVKAHGRKPQTVDVGKCRALRAAGWAVEDIANEVEVSIASVYKAIKEEQ